MRSRLPRKPAEPPDQADQSDRRSGQREIAGAVYRRIDQSSLNRFTYSFIDSLWNDLNAAVLDLDRLPEADFRSFVEVIQGLVEARNELRLARFLFEVQEINAVYRLVMRNRAVLRGRDRLRRVLRVWP